MDKRGAIELSMTTIIVIVIGITLLILGLTWVRGLFGQVSSFTDKSFRIANDLIQQQMGTSEKVYVDGSVFEVESGGTADIYIGIQNFGDPGVSNEFSVSVNDENNVKSDWFVIAPVGLITTGERKGIPAVLKVPKNVEPGTVKGFSIIVLRDGVEWGSRSVLVKVKE